MPHRQPRLQAKPVDGDKKQRKIARKTFNWNEIPVWQRDNEYILSGYRGELRTWKRCLSSTFTYFHNETVNIHSHYIGCILFAFLWLYHLRGVYLQYQDTMNVGDKTFMTFFMMGALFCLFLSGSYHMMSSHSLPINNIFHRFDYSGIVILTVGSFYPAVYYGFYCDSTSAHFWLTILTISGAITAYVVLSPTYSTPQYRRTRTYLFIALGLSGAAPLIHLFALEGYGHLQTLGINWLGFSAILYIGGALIYAERFPEKIWPGRFDYVFASHQIFHVCVVLAALAHYRAMMCGIAHWHGVHKGSCHHFNSPLHM